MQSLNFTVLEHINLISFPSCSLLLLFSFAKNVDAFSIIETPGLSPGVSQVRQSVQLYVKSKGLRFRSKIVNATSLEVVVTEREQQKDWLMHAAANSLLDPKPDMTVINSEIEFLQVFIFHFFAREDFMFPFVTRV